MQAVGRIGEAKLGKKVRFSWYVREDRLRGSPAYVVDMVPEEAKEFTEKIRDANVRYDRALTRLGNEGLNLEEIDRTISEVTRAHQDVTDALQRLRELIVMS